jgi:ribosome-binding factor A
LRQFKRSDRLGAQMLKDISSLVDTELADKLPGMVTFTHVRLSSDLSYATVYYSCMGNTQEREAVSHSLEKNKKKIRRLVGNNLHVRRVPELIFKFDPSVAEGIKIERLLNEISQKSED